MDSEAPLESLCDLFDDELERQETVLSVTAAQGRAARNHDQELLEAKTATLHLLIQQAVDAEKERLDLVRKIVDAYGLPEEQQNLTALIAAAPEPWKTRMREFQDRMREILEKTRAVVQSNGRVMRRSLKIIGNALDSVLRNPAAPETGYDARGTEHPVSRASLIDHKG